MDSDDFDQTQAIAFDDQDYNDDTDDLAPDGDKKPVSFLKVPLQKGLNEASYPLYEGDNIIGRNQDTCHVHIPSKSLSKEHACIQIVGDVHMIFDKGSRNKTRRGKLFLNPEVRYELKNNEEITFADVKCVYQIFNELDTVAESGSDTEGSESLMLKYDVTDETPTGAAQRKANVSAADSESNNDDDSVLPPTQSYPGEHSKCKVIVKDTPESAKSGRKTLDTDVPLPTLVLSESETDEEEEDDVGQTKRSAKDKVIHKAGAEIQETLLCEDSDPECSRDKFQFAAATQAYNVADEDESSRHSLIGAATQAYGPTKDASDEEGETDRRLMNEPTQAFLKSDHATEDPSESTGTQSFKVKQKSLSGGNKETGAKELNASDSSTAATQVFEDDDDDNDFNGEGLFAAATMACDDDIVGEDDEEKDGENNLLDPDAATQVFDAEAPTQNVVSKENGCGNLGVRCKVSKGRKETQADTLVVSSSSDAATVPASNFDSHLTRSNNNRSQQNCARGNASDLPTQVVSAEGEAEEEDKTQVFEEGTIAVEDISSEGKPRQPEPVRKANDKQGGKKAVNELETLPVQDSDIPVALSKKKPVSSQKPESKEDHVLDTLVIGCDENSRDGVDDPTQLIDAGESGCEVKDAAGDVDEPTQDFANSSSDLLTQVFSPSVNTDSPGKVNKQKPSTSRKPNARRGERNTVAVSSDEEDDDYADEKPWMVAAANEPTQAYDASDDDVDNPAEQDRPKLGTPKKSAITEQNKDTLAILSNEDEDDNEEGEKPWKQVNEDEPTQAYNDCDDDDNEVEDTTDHGAVGKTVDAEEPTQAYCLIGDEDSDEVGDEQVKRVALSEEATQAYGLGCNVDEEQNDDLDADATQPFDNDIEEDNDSEVTEQHAPNVGPTQKYDMAVEETAIVSHQRESEKADEDSDDDSDLEETSVLLMDQVAEALAESPLAPGTSDSTTAVKMTSPAGRRNLSKMSDKVTKPTSTLLDPPLSPEIPDKSSESPHTLKKKELSDTEEMVPDSMTNSDEVKAETESEPVIPLPLPAQSPLKSALVDRRRSPSPARKHVNFIEPEPSVTKEDVMETDTAKLKGGRAKRTVKTVTRGRSTRNVRSDSGEELSLSGEDQKGESEGHNVKESISKNNTETKQPQTGRSSRKDVDHSNSVKDQVTGSAASNEITGQSSSLGHSQVEASSKSVEANEEKKELPSRSTRGRKKKVNEVPEKTEDNCGAAATLANLTKNRKTEKVTIKAEEKEAENAEELTQVGQKENLKVKEKTAPPGESASPSSNLPKKGAVEKEEEKNCTKEQPLPSRKSRASAGKGNDNDKDLEASPSGAEGRMSSRGRRITASNHLKDYDTSRNRKGRVSRSSMHTPSPSLAVEESPGIKASNKTVSNSDHPPPKPAGSTASQTKAKTEENIAKQAHTFALQTKTAESVLKQAESPAPECQEKASCETSHPPLISDVASEPTRMGKRGRANVQAGSDCPPVTTVDKAVNIEKVARVSSDNEKPKPSTTGGNLRRRGKRLEDKEDGEESTADSEKAESVASEDSGTIKSSPKKTRGQMSSTVTEAGNERVGDDSVKKTEVITEEIVTGRKRGRKSVFGAEEEVASKQSKKRDTVKDESTEESSEAEEPRRGCRQSKVVAKPEEKPEQSVASAVAKKDSSAPQGRKSRRGQVSARASTSNKNENIVTSDEKSVTSDSVSINKAVETTDTLKSSRSAKSQKASESKSSPDVQENENSVTNTSNIRGRGKGRKSAVVNSTTPAVSELENKRSSDPQDKVTSESEKYKMVPARGTSKQRSKTVAGNKDTNDQKQLEVSQPEEKPDQSSQSSISSARGRRGAKRSAVLGEGLAKQDNQGLTTSSGKESGHLSPAKKQSRRNAKKSTVEPEKETNTGYSQPSPSPAKKSRKSSPPPSTPSRKIKDSPVNSPSLRKSTLNHQPKVMFTGVIDDQGEKIVKDLGGDLVSNIQDCTHLITDKIRRTVKFLGGLAKGALIVTPQWLESSKRAKTFLDGNKFLVSDAAMEKQYRFSLQSSIEKASMAPLLQGYSLHVTPSVRPDPTQMKDILHCAGAKYLSTMPTKPQPQTVVISCPEDQALWSSAAKAGVPVVGAEFILTGLLRQELQPQAFSLIKADTSQTVRGRGRHT